MTARWLRHIPVELSSATVNYNRGQVQLHVITSLLFFLLHLYICSLSLPPPPVSFVLWSPRPGTWLTPRADLFTEPGGPLAAMLRKCLYCHSLPYVSILGCYPVISSAVEGYCQNITGHTGPNCEINPSRESYCTSNRGWRNKETWLVTTHSLLPPSGKVVPVEGDLTEESENFICEFWI